MTTRPLRLGPLSAQGYQIQRSDLRWLIQPGQACRANEVFAYCTISMSAVGGRSGGPAPGDDELELQVGFASRIAGRILGAAHERGGFWGVRSVDLWAEDTVIAQVEPDEADGGPPEPSDLRLLMLAGRRVTELANRHAGLFSGWLSRSRGWWCDRGETPVTLLSLGICDATGVVLGDEAAFLEMFEAAAGSPAQIVYINERPLVHVAPVLLDQMARTPAEAKAIAADLHRFVAESAVVPTHEDWVMFGGLLAMLLRSPIDDSYTLHSPSGLLRVKPADVILLSLSAEPQVILRHKALGYHIHVMPYHRADAGPVFRQWLATAFDPVKRSHDDIRRDYERLIDVVGRTTGARIAIINRMSTSGYEDISSYAAFDAPMSETLSQIAAKELNLMLHDIAETRDLVIIDLDALAAELGGAEHVPDGIHQSAALQAALRAELLDLLDQKRQSQTPS